MYDCALLQLMNHQIEQLKEEITLRDHALVKEHFRHHSADKEKEVLKNDVQKLRKQIASSGGIAAAQVRQSLSDHHQPYTLAKGVS
jgi:hypothetical protein